MGKWVTINGAHVYIEDGQSLMDAFIRGEMKNKRTKEMYQKSQLPLRKIKKANLDNIIEEMEKNDMDLNDIVYVDKYYTGITADEIKENIKNNKIKLQQSEEAYVKAMQQYAKSAKENQAFKEKIINEKISEGITQKQAEKEYEAIAYREKKMNEVKKEYEEIKQKESGYLDNKKSVRAIKAEYDNKFPATEASKMLGVTKKSIEDNLVPDEWHHSGGTMYNKINYYDISKYIDLSENGIEYYKDDLDYKQEIAIWQKMRKVKGIY